MTCVTSYQPPPAHPNPLTASKQASKPLPILIMPRNEQAVNPLRNHYSQIKLACQSTQVLISDILPNRYLRSARMVMRSAKRCRYASTKATRSDAAVLERMHRAQPPVFGRHMHSCSGFRSENRRTGALTVVSATVHAGCQGCMHQAMCMMDGAVVGG